ncbi:MAG: catalase, partial [Xenococcus sp. (in: cyanobacteria)]
MAQSFELGKEYPPEGEELQIQQILEISHRAMLDKSKATKPPVTRDQHPKSHGYVQGEFTVEANISKELKVGVFAEAKTYPIWIRFSNGDSARVKKGTKFQPDTVGDIRGMAIKLM